jgi:hypothetical protein
MNKILSEVLPQVKMRLGRESQGKRFGRNPLNETTRCARRWEVKRRSANPAMKSA